MTTWIFSTSICANEKYFEQFNDAYFFNVDFNVIEDISNVSVQIGMNGLPNGGVILSFLFKYFFYSQNK